MVTSKAKFNTPKDLHSHLFLSNNTNKIIINAHPLLKLTHQLPHKSLKFLLRSHENIPAGEILKAKQITTMSLQQFVNILHCDFLIINYLEFHFLV